MGARATGRGGVIGDKGAHFGKAALTKFCHSFVIGFAGATCGLHRDAER